MGGKPRARTAPDGIVVIDKPAGMTSHDVVARMRKVLGTRAVGHAGTLDPMATGVLVIGVERGTKLLGHLTQSSKTYDATIRLGASTTTDDAEGEVTAVTPAGHIADEAIRSAAGRFIGVVQQRPSSVSAIKVDGVRSYARVRAGETVELPAREVTIHDLVIHGIRRSDATVDVDVTIRCSSGTYIRSIARDLGTELGVGGHLVALRRTAAGNFTLAQSIELPAIDAHVEPMSLKAVLQREYSVVSLDSEQSQRVRHGMRIPAIDAPPGLCGLLDDHGAVLALSEAVDGVWRHSAVFGDVIG